MNSDKHNWQLLSLKSHICHITLSLLQHVLKMSSSSTNESGRRWHYSL